jgi:NAD dependent epimerase/dehydratase family enzyme
MGHEYRNRNNKMRVIITGTTGMVGEGVLLECLQNNKVSEVLSISRKPCGSKGHYRSS